MTFRRGEVRAEDEPGEIEVDVGSSPAGPCASESCIRPGQNVRLDGEVLVADPEGVEYPDDFLEHMRNHKVGRDSPVWGMLWGE